MTNPLGTITTFAEDIVSAPLEFTKHMAQQFQDYVIGALGKPIPATDPLAAYRYNEARARTLQDGFRQRPLLRMQDKNLQQLVSIGGERSCRFEEIATDTGEAGVVIRGGDDLGDFVRNAVRLEEDLHLSIDINPLRLSYLTRWGGKITTINVKRDVEGIHTVELIASAQREHLKHVLVGTNPFFPPEAQLLSMWMLPANCRTACFTTLFINLMRQFVPGLSTLTNIANPFAWINPIGPDALLNFNPMQWPIQVGFVNPLLDQSRTTVFTGAWNDFHTASLDTMRDAGVCARAYTYFTDDVDNPQTELAELLPKTPLNSIPIVGSLVSAVEAFLERTGLVDLPDNATVADLSRPQRNCVFVNFEDHSGYGGPTGTAVDGVINLFASTLDDLITTTVIPIDADDDGEVDPLFRTLFGVAPPTPWAVYRDGQHSGIIESNYTQHKGPVKTIMTGGKSPKLVNDLQCLAGDSEVDGPDGKNRIDALAASGKPFRVWSLTPEGERVAAVATHAFKKGRAELFEYELDNGRTIKATAQHRFLTDAGFVHGENIDAGAFIATGPHRVLPASSATVIHQPVNDGLYEALPETEALIYRKVVEVRSVGTGDFYDMHVPGWENYSANGFWNHNTFGIKLGLSQLQTVIVAGFGGSSGGPPIGAGLDELYQGQLDNKLLAWQRYTDPLRALITGDLGYLESFERGNSAYTISGILTLRQGNWKTRAFRSFKTSIRQSAPFILYYDILLDDRVGFEQDGIMYVDQAHAIKYEYDRNKPITFTVSVGDDTKDQDPFSQGIKALQGIASVIGAVIGGDAIF